MLGREHMLKPLDDLGLQGVIPGIAQRRLILADAAVLRNGRRLCSTEAVDGKFA